MPHDIKAYLWDIKEACQDILEFTAEMDFISFEVDKRTRFAVERQLLVIGEAANHLPDDYRKKHIHIPWRQIIGLRNIIAHEYGEILSKRIWSIINKDVEKLARQIEELIDKA